MNVGNNSELTSKHYKPNGGYLCITGISITSMSQEYIKIMFVMISLTSTCVQIIPNSYWMYQEISSSGLVPGSSSWTAVNQKERPVLINFDLEPDTTSGDSGIFMNV